MPRAVYLIGSLIFAAAATLFMQSGNDVEAVPTDGGGPTNEIVVLLDGTTMTAPSGTLGLDVADWLATDTAASKTFYFGADAFAGDTGHMTPQGLERAAKLGMILRATPNARMVIGGGSDAGGDQSRAKTLQDFLSGRGVLQGQVSVEGAASYEPRGLALVISRKRQA